MTLRPRAQHRVEDLPGALRLVAPGEERGIPDHGVQQERLVRVGRVDREARPVAEVHVHAADLQALAGYLGAEADQDPLVWLDADGEDVRIKLRRAGTREKRQRRAAELDGDLRDARRHRLAGAEVEGHPRPAP